VKSAAQSRAKLWPKVEKAKAEN